MEMAKAEKQRFDTREQREAETAQNKRDRGDLPPYRESQKNNRTQNGPNKKKGEGSGSGSDRAGNNNNKNNNNNNNLNRACPPGR